MDKITDSLIDLDIGQMTVNKVTKQLGFQLQILRKKPYLVPFTKIHYKYWCHARRLWKISKQRKYDWLDEAKMVYVAYQPGRKVQIRPREKLEQKNLAPSFKSGSIEVGS